MEVKKSPKADLQNKKSIFLLTGLIIALGVVIFMFNWSQSEVEIERFNTQAEIIEVEQTEITRQEEPKVEPPKVTAPVVSDILEVVENKIETDTDMSAFDVDSGEGTEIIIKDVGGEAEELVAEDEVIVRAEKMPTFQGGDLVAFRTWVAKRIKYPSIAEENGITGNVTVRFIVEKDCSVGNIEILKSPDKSLSDEATRVIKESPKWTPGEQRGKPVRVYIVVPITFNL